MKKKMKFLKLAFLLVSLQLCMLTSCGASKMRKVTFYVDDAVVEVVESKGNESIELPEDPTKEGYYFVGWYYDNQEFTEDEFLDTKLTEDIEVYAQFKKYIHIHYEMNGGAYEGTGVPGELPDGDLPDEYLKEGEGLHYGDTVISKESNIFAGWFDNADFNGEPIRMPYYPTSDMTLYARWAEKYPVLENGMELVYSYSYDDTFPSGYALVSYNGTATEIDIPATYKGLPIVEVGSNVFSRKDITSVVTHNNLIKINYSAFASCYSLKSVVIADTVTMIEENAFNWCKQLTDISFGKGVTYIGRGAFMATAWYYALPQGANYINDTFLLFKNYDSEGNYQKLSELTIREGTTNIADGALQDQANLKILHLPESLKEIGKSAFRGCKLLEEVTLPSHVETMNSQAFQESGLKSIVIPDSLKMIGEQSFYNCASLKKVTIGKGVTEIAFSAFSKSGIEEIDLPENVTEYSGAFSECESLTKMTIRCKIPCGLYSLPDSLQTIYVPSDALEAFKEESPAYADRFFAIEE